jgi:hypothetical protein
MTSVSGLFKCLFSSERFSRTSVSRVKPSRRIRYVLKETAETVAPVAAVYATAKVGTKQQDVLLPSGAAL